MPEGNDLRLPQNPQFEFLLNHGKTMREWSTVPLYVGIIAAPPGWRNGGRSCLRIH